MPEKEFVKAKPLQGPKERGNGGGFQQRQPRKNLKKYEQKVHQKDNRDGIKLMLSAYRQINKTDLVVGLQKKYPKIFVENSVKPEEDGNFNFNDCLKGALKKEAYSKFTKQLSSDSSEPDWDSDCDREVKLESKRIDEEVVKKIQEKIKKQPPKKLDQLQRHEKQFLSDYYREKRNAELQKEKQNERQEKQEHKTISKEESQAPPIDEWNEYNPQVDGLIAKGYLQKINIDESEDDFQLDNDFDFQEDDMPAPKPQIESSSEESDGDDMFEDDKPRIITEKKAGEQKQANQIQKGKVCINNHVFSQIVENIGLPPDSCTWVISNKTERYKLTTHYMNTMYHQKQLHKTFPYVSLNHSQFVKYEDIGTEKGLEKFRKFNERKIYQQNKNNYQLNRGKKQIIYKPRK